MTVTKTIIIKTKGRTWWSGIMGGHKARLALDEVTKDLPADSIVSFEGEDLTVCSGYGVDLKFQATTIVSVRSAAEAREAAAPRREAERWLGFAESDARSSRTVTNAMCKALELCPAFPDLADRLESVRESVAALQAQEDQFEAEKWLAWAEPQVADGLTDSKSIREALRLAPAHPALAERLAALRVGLNQAAGQSEPASTADTTPTPAAARPRDRVLADQPPLDKPVKLGDEWIVYTRLARTFRTDEDADSLYGGQFLGREGDLAYVVEYRPATAEEATAAQAKADQRARERAEKERLTAEAWAIFRQVQADGERPEGRHVLASDHLLGAPTAYGTGQWVVIDEAHIWAVQNNGMDGDSWANNNVSTGGAGAIGRRIPLDADLAARIIELHEAGVRI